MTKGPEITRMERTLREEMWILTDELFAPERPEPPEVAAFRIVQEDDWVYFIDDVSDNSALKFFNPEIKEFSSAEDWEALGAEYGVEEFAYDLAIPDGLHPKARDFCRDFRAQLRVGGDESSTPHNKMFWTPEEWGVKFPSHSGLLLVVMRPPYSFTKPECEKWPDFLKLAESVGLDCEAGIGRVTYLSHAE